MITSKKTRILKQLQMNKISKMGFKIATNRVISTLH